MKNFEAYESKIKKLKCDIAMNQNSELVSCNDFCCRNCKFGVSDKPCPQNIISWLYEEYKNPKIKIHLATKVILENIDEKWKWIVKDINNDVIFFENKPMKGKRIWTNNVMGGGRSNLTYIFKNKLFDFLSWEDEEPTNIKELLENCEVID